MSKYKAGDKVVLDILATDEDGYYKLGNKIYSWWDGPTDIDIVSEPLSEYTEKLEKKNENKQKRIEKLVERLHRQASEITRLLAENAELKEKIRNMADTFENFKACMCDACDHIDSVEKARAAWQEEAWKLALKLRYMDYEDKVECFGLEYDGKEKWIEIMEKHTYTEAAAKVAEWERAKEEIHVGDIVRIHEGNDNDLCIICSSSDGYYNAVDKYGAVYPTLYKKMISKTGRHIDVNVFLEQIGGESE